MCVDFCTQMTVKANWPLAPLLNSKSVNYEPVSYEIKLFWFNIVEIVYNRIDIENFQAVKVF